MTTNSSLYKMAVAAKIINQGDAFLPQDADKLLGKTLQFKTQVFFNRGKDGKDYYGNRVQSRHMQAITRTILIRSKGINKIVNKDKKIQFRSSNNKVPFRQWKI